jgi:hypothetical protein
MLTRLIYGMTPFDPARIDNVNTVFHGPTCETGLLVSCPLNITLRVGIPHHASRNACAISSKSSHRSDRSIVV